MTHAQTLDRGVACLQMLPNMAIVLSSNHSQTVHFLYFHSKIFFLLLLFLLQKVRIFKSIFSFLIKVKF